MRKASHRRRFTRRAACAAGFSLLEVILALAILGGAIAVLGEAARLAMKNAEYTRDINRAQLLCESKLAEIVAGITPAEASDGVALKSETDASEPAWLYSIETTSVDDGLLSVRVTVTRDLPAEKHPVRFSLVRWMADPEAGQSATPAATQQPSNPASQ